jgi:hypothetical protein
MKPRWWWKITLKESNWILWSEFIFFKCFRNLPSEDKRFWKLQSKGKYFRNLRSEFRRCVYFGIYSSLRFAAAGLKLEIYDADLEDKEIRRNVMWCWEYIWGLKEQCS